MRTQGLRLPVNASIRRVLSQTACGSSCPIMRLGWHGLDDSNRCKSADCNGYCGTRRIGVILGPVHEQQQPQRSVVSRHLPGMLATLGICRSIARFLRAGHCVTRKTIYHDIYAIRVGEVCKEIIAALRHTHNNRVPNSKCQERRGQTPASRASMCVHLRLTTASPLKTGRET